jgi:hypothetical protein
MVCCACVQVYLFGGAVCSWKQASGDEVLYVRPDAVFDKVSPGATCRSCIMLCGSRLWPAVSVLDTGYMLALDAHTSVHACTGTPLQTPLTAKHNHRRHNHGVSSRNPLTRRGGS